MTAFDWIIALLLVAACVAASKHGDAVLERFRREDEQLELDFEA